MNLSSTVNSIRDVIHGLFFQFLQWFHSIAAVSNHPISSALEQFTERRSEKEKPDGVEDCSKGGKHDHHQHSHHHNHHHDCSEHAVTLLDGSMGSQLRLDGMPQDELFRKIWSSRAIVDTSLHKLVKQAHRRYLQAGSKVLSTNSYAVQPKYYRAAYPDNWKARMSEDAECAAKLCREAISEWDGEDKENVKVYGSLGPICESHRPDLTRAFLKEHGPEYIKEHFAITGKALVRGGADVLLLETINCWEEAKLGVEALSDLGVPLVVSFEGALRTEALQPQTHLAPAMAREVLAAKKAGAPICTLGFNCAPPEFLLQCLTHIRATEGLSEELKEAGIDIAVYANCNDREAAHSGGFKVSTDDSTKIEARGDLVDEKYAGYVDFVKKFIELGATFVGGCCGCSHEGIENIRRGLKKSV